MNLAFSKYLDELRQWLAGAVGRHETEVKQSAREGGAKIRVTKRDGVAKEVDSGYDANRVNIEVEGGIVTRVRLG